MSLSSLLRAVLCWTASVAMADPLVLRLAYGDLPSPPYFYGSGIEMPEDGGVAVTLARNAASTCGLRLKLFRYPSRRLYDKMHQGEMDAAFMYSYHPDRLSWAVYPTQDGKPDPHLRMTTLTYVYYARGTARPGWDGKRLDTGGAGVGANAGWSIATDLRAQGLTVEEASNTESNFRKLAAGRIVAFALQDHIGDAYLAQHPELGLVKLLPPISSKDYFLVFSHPWFQRYPAAAQCLWTQLARLRETALPGLLREHAAR